MTTKTKMPFSVAIDGVSIRYSTDDRTPLHGERRLQWCLQVSGCGMLDVDTRSLRQLQRAIKAALEEHDEP